MDISKFKRCHILVVGDLMIDEYVWGQVERISPEAPIQVVSVEKEDYTLGGAGNVINNLVALGARVSAAGVIGGGQYGNLLVDKLKNLGVHIEGVVREPDRPTTRKTRIIAANQHVLRIDRESHQEISDSILDALSEKIAAKVPTIDIVLISDYDKGVVAPALLARLVKVASQHHKMVIVDPKGIDFSKYSGVSVLTPNLKEAALAAGIDRIHPSTPLEAATKVLESLDIETLLITQGREGMVLFRRGQAPLEIKAKARQVYDVSGAGDTVLAVFGLALASGIPMDDAARCANTAAGVVVGKVGTATVSKDELASALAHYPLDLSIKHKGLKELGVLVRELKMQGKKIVLTNGCFDLLHAGHILLFSASKQQGDVLIVATDDDASVQRLKGTGRPVINANQRVRILSALDSIDYVIVFSSEELKEIIETIRPDILTKGSNYTEDEVLEHEFVEQLGGRVVLIPVSEEISTTRIINDIKRSA
jgi:D-beta-D-heptose 7-phosphate kinase/D-beta-D-heptose 1-phosphate adenosyltransferase